MDAGHTAYREAALIMRNGRPSEMHPRFEVKRDGLNK
jgi:hypothetical protein